MTTRPARGRTARTLRHGRIVLREMIPADIGDHVRWETTETAWLDWDARTTRTYSLKRARSSSKPPARARACTSSYTNGTRTTDAQRLGPHYSSSFAPDAASACQLAASRLRAPQSTWLVFEDGR